MNFDEIKVGCPWHDYDDNKCEHGNGECSYHECPFFYWVKTALQKLRNANTSTNKGITATPKPCAICKSKDDCVSRFREECFNNDYCSWEPHKAS